MPTRLVLADVCKSFTMHLQGGLVLPVVRNVSFHVDGGECVVLDGPSGAGKSSVLKMVYGNYRVDEGQILVTARSGPVDVAAADPRTILALRRTTIGYASQFLRVVPRVATLDVVAEPLVEGGMPREAARERARLLLARLDIPERLWSLPPATFSGGEQQRVNVARSLITDHPVLLLDEPTASLDARNRRIVVELIGEKKRAGVALLGIFHDAEVRQAVADRIVDVTAFAAAA